MISIWTYVFHAVARQPRQTLQDIEAVTSLKRKRLVVILLYLAKAGAILAETDAHGITRFTAQQISRVELARRSTFQ